MPQAARAHTKAGAQAFAEFYITQLNKAWTVPDPEILRPYSTPACKTCSAFVSSAEDLKSKKQHYDGSPITVGATTYLPESGSSRVLVWAMTVQEDREIVASDGRAIEKISRRATRAQIEVVWHGASGWRINSFRNIEIKT